MKIRHSIRGRSRVERARRSKRVTTNVSPRPCPCHGSANGRAATASVFVLPATRLLKCGARYGMRRVLSYSHTLKVLHAEAVVPLAFFYRRGPKRRSHVRLLRNVARLGGCCLPPPHLEVRRRAAGTPSNHSRSHAFRSWSTAGKGPVPPAAARATTTVNSADVWESSLRMTDPPVVR